MWPSLIASSNHMWVLLQKFTETDKINNGHQTRYLFSIVVGDLLIFPCTFLRRISHSHQR